MPQPSPDVEPQPSVPAPEVQAELEAVLRSPVFERSERLQRFLRFICEMRLKGEANRINEYLIGSEVFQRGPDYSPTEDSIVRRQALSLRQKLQEYYSTEGADHVVRIELPVGRYVPVFRRVETAAPLGVTAAVSTPQSTVAAAPPEQPAAEIVTPAPSGPASAIRHLYRWVAIAVSLLVGGIILGYFLPHGKAVQDSQSPGTATTEIWGDWLSPATKPIICFSNPLTAVIKQYQQPLPPDTVLKRFRAHPDEESVFRSFFKLPEGGYIYYVPAVNQTKVGEAVAGVHLATLLTKAGATVRTAQSRFLSWDELRNNDYILLGSNEANQWLELILKDYPFHLATTGDDKQRGILNLKPAPGEQAEYRIAYSQSERDMDREYVLVSMITGISPDHKLLLINGLNSQGTQAAAEYLTSETTLQELLGRLQAAAPGHKGPWRFQAILRTEVYDKVPTKPTLVLLRVL